MERRAHSFEAFEKVGSRAAQAITKVGIAIARSDAGWRVVANSVAPTVRRCRSVETRLESGPSFSDPTELDDLLRQDVSPIDDIRSTARYRRQVLANLLFHHLGDGRR